MQTLRFTLRPQTAFGTPLVGDTLFGQLCWALRRRFGKGWLTERLTGYIEGSPFLVLSDAFPQGFLPLPTVPASCWNARDDADRKALKKKRWLPVESLSQTFSTWQDLAHNDAETTKAVIGASYPVRETRPQPHNSINRATATTDENFTPYTQVQHWFHPDMRFDLYAVLDEARITAAELTAVLEDIGQNGYGRDASIGLGKFAIAPDTVFTAWSSMNANAFLTLAPSAPQGLGFDAAKSFYQPLTRFGRHGDVAVYSSNPFKRPLLLAKTGAVFTPFTFDVNRAFIGQGLGGVSASQPEAVAQGYAPVIGIRMENWQ
jgi:CRISPR-associated protein Csm4